MRVDGHSLATVSTHSRPKAAGGYRNVQGNFLTGFNTQPPEGGWFCFIRFILIFDLFQHTAARRRLETVFLTVCSWLIVSTHSRPKAAGIHIVCRLDFIVVSTHSRPKAAGSYAV